MDIVESNLGKLETQLQDWGTKLTQLAEKAGAAATADYRKTVEDLKGKHLDAQMKLNQLKAGGTEKWSTLKGGVEAAWLDLETAFTKLKS